MRIPKHILLEIQDELKKSSEKEHSHLMTERAQLKFKMSIVDEKLKRARDLLLDLSISKDEYNEIKAELEVERHNIDVKLQSLSNADDSFNETIGIIFELASKAHELFKSSEIEEKGRIITILFPNLKMDGKNLVFELRKPFDMFVNCEDHPDWLGWMDSNHRMPGPKPGALPLGYTPIRSKKSKVYRKSIHLRRGIYDWRRCKINSKTASASAFISASWLRSTIRLNGTIASVYFLA